MTEEHVCYEDREETTTIIESSGFTKETRTWYCVCGALVSSSVVDTHMGEPQ